MACRSIVAPFLSYTGYTHLPLDTQTSELQHFWCWGFCGGGATGAWGMRPLPPACDGYLTVPATCLRRSLFSFLQTIRQGLVQRASWRRSWLQWASWARPGFLRPAPETGCHGKTHKCRFSNKWKLLLNTRNLASLTEWLSIFP